MSAPATSPAPVPTADHIRAVTLMVFLAGAVLTALLASVAAVFPSLWSLTLIAAVHTPVAALGAAYKAVGDTYAAETA